MKRGLLKKLYLCYDYFLRLKIFFSKNKFLSLFANHVTLWKDLALFIVSISFKNIKKIVNIYRVFYLIPLYLEVFLTFMEID